MAWPTVADFNDAVQNPERCFSMQELVQGTVAVTPRRLPLVYSGNFACVYKVATGAGDVAVRCFTREVKDQQERYGRLSEYLRGVLPEAFVGFEYLEHGIRVRGQWYPIVKMDWAPGDRLDKFIGDNINSPDTFERLAARWRGVNATLRGLGIAHNDLQHGNVMVQQQGSIRLVDYDGIFLPRFQGEDSPELGHRHFQHPKRSVHDYHAGIDNFPSLVLYVSLLALSVAPELWEKFYTQENLLFTKDDFADPSESDCFRALKNSRDTRVADLAASLEEFCSLPVDQVPDLESVLDPSSAAPSPAGTAVTTPESVSGTAPSSTPTSDYRKLIQSGQMSPPSPVVLPPKPAPPPILMCPKCRRVGSPELIYCAVESCAAVLHPGSRTCKECRSSVPVKALYCTECGVNLNAPTKA